jgi:hypothetical protein
MSKKLDLTGKKFNKLTAISPADNIVSENGDTCTTWNCLCDCGKEIVVITKRLTLGKTKSCGCLRFLNGTIFKPGQKINRLTMVSYNNGYWTCKCDCGNIAEVVTNELTSEKVKSCGCLRKEIALKNMKIANISNVKYIPRIYSARRRWTSYLRRDKLILQFKDFKELTFDEWYELSQKNCFYCGAEPSNMTNCFENNKEGLFINNGLDRVDNSKPHTIDNVVPCCHTCNSAKCDKSLINFYEYIDILQINNFDPNYRPIIIDISDNDLLSLIKCVYNRYKRGHFSIDVDIKIFYAYSQMPCFYCGVEGSNCNYDDSEIKYKYNGIDRIDSSKSHTIDNIVSCCKRCNFAKRALSLSKFHEWITRIKEHQKKNKII